MPNSKPVFVPKNECEKDPAARLAAELAKGLRSGEAEGRLPLEAVDKHLGLRRK